MGCNFKGSLNPQDFTVPNFDGRFCVSFDGMYTQLCCYHAGCSQSVFLDVEFYFKLISDKKK